MVEAFPPPFAIAFVSNLVPAGYPSPAQDYIDSTLDLNEHLIDDKTSTFIIPVEDDSMEGAGIFVGDKLIVDRSKQAVHGSVVVAIIDGELTVKRLLKTPRGPVLAPGNPKYPSILIPSGSELLIWGVATWCLHHFPSPVRDKIGSTLDLNEYLIKDKTSTFITQVAGDSMEGAGIFDGDKLIVDLAEQAVHGSVVIAIIDGELTVKRLLKTPRGPVLAPENPKYPSVPVSSSSEFSIWGVVTWCLHHV